MLGTENTGGYVAIVDKSWIRLIHWTGILHLAEGCAEDLVSHGWFMSGRIFGLIMAVQYIHVNTHSVAKHKGFRQTSA